MIATLDLTIILVYLAIILFIGVMVGKREKLSDFLVNSRRTKSVLLVFTIISTSVGMGTLLGVAAAGYDTGISFALTAAIGVLIGFILVGLLAPRIKKFGDKFKAYTFGDFFGVRYSQANRVLVGIIVLISYFFWMAVQFVAIAALIKVLTGWGFGFSLILSSLIVITYTTIAGIKSDFYTDAIQFWVILIVLFLVLLPMSLIKVGGFSALAALPAKYFNPFSFGGVAFFFAGLIFGAAMLLVSMEAWQRIYASIGPRSARKVFLWSALINTPLIIFPAFLGMIAALMFTGLDKNLALFELMTNTLPVGLLGLGVAGILAAAMSTVDSMIMVGSATILKDFYKSFFNPVASERRMLRLGRLFTFLFGLAGLVTAYLISDIIQLMLIGSFTLLCFAPAVVGGFFWKRATAKASFWSILIGFSITIILLPFLPKMAFVPGFFASIIIFVVLSFTTSHKLSENMALD